MPLPNVSSAFTEEVLNQTAVELGSKILKGITHPNGPSEELTSMCKLLFNEDVGLASVVCTLAITAPHYMWGKLFVAGALFMYFMLRAASQAEAESLYNS